MLPSVADSCPTSTIVLQPRKGFGAIPIRDLLEYRDLLWLLALRDIQVRYKQTALGALWAVIQPLVLMVVFAVFLGPYTGVTDPVKLYTGLLPWTLFAACVTAASNSLVGNAGMLGKIYFPRLILPLAALGAPLIDFTIALLVLAGMMTFFGIAFTSSLVLLPLFVGIALVLAAGVGILLAALTVTYRDFRYVVPFMLQVWFFASGILVPVPVWAKTINPVAGIIDGFRSAVTGEPLDVVALGISAVGAFVLIVIGTLVFARTERKFADVV